jgi:hypothetical protein
MAIESFGSKLVEKSDLYNQEEAYVSFFIHPSIEAKPQADGHHCCFIKHRGSIYIVQYIIFGVAHKLFNTYIKQVTGKLLSTCGRFLCCIQLFIG